MRVAVLFSGGKDSCYTVWLLQHQGWEVATLLTVKPTASDSLLFHYPGVNWTDLQAKAMGIPLRTVNSGVEELGELEKELVLMRKEVGISGLATGAVASDYQKTRFDRACEGAGLKSFSPLWRKDPHVLVDDLVGLGYRIIMTGVGALGLDESWLGKELTEQEWKRLEELSSRYGIHMSGEGGEYETFVIDGPLFEKKVQIQQSKKVWSGQSGHLAIERASLRD